MVGDSLVPTHVAEGHVALVPALLLQVEDYLHVELKLNHVPAACVMLFLMEVLMARRKMSALSLFAFSVGTQIS